MPPKFRLSAKYVSLTYPRTEGSLSKSRARRALVAQQPSPTGGCICEERHADGGTHLHVLVHFQVRPNIKSERHFDIDGRHPHIKPCTDPRGWYEYITKEDGEPLRFGTLPEPLPGRGGSGRDRSFIDLAIAGDYVEAKEAFINRHPLQYAIHADAVERTLRRLRPAAIYVPYDLGTFIEQPGIREWRREEETLHLWGPTGIGKTKYAQALISEGGNRPYRLIRHLTGLRGREEGSGIIFDDVAFKTLDIEEVIHIVDCCDETQVNIKHSVAFIERGCPRIITSNFADIWPPDPAGALGRRVRTVECKAPLHRDLQAAEPAEEPSDLARSLLRSCEPQEEPRPQENPVDPPPFEFIDLTAVNEVAPGLFLFPEEENDLYF